MFRDLFNTYRLAFRLFIRQRMRPLTVEEAEEKRLFWARTYAFCALAAALLATFNAKVQNINFNYRTDIPKNEAVLERLTDAPQTKVVRILNFKKVDEFIYTKNPQPAEEVKVTQ